MTAEKGVNVFTNDSMWKDLSGPGTEGVGVFINVKPSKFVAEPSTANFWTLGEKCAGLIVLWTLSSLPRVGWKLILMVIQCMMWGGHTFKEEYLAGGSGRLHLPSPSASRERRRATWQQEFRIKGGCILQNLEKDPTGLWHSGLSLSLFIRTKLILAGLFCLLCGL